MENTTEYRYEKKYIVKTVYVKEVLSLLKLHPAAYYKIYPHRYVNSVYFDTSEMRNYHSHIHGELQRKKIRIRWYGEEEGLIERPVLELKEKKGDVGLKRSYSLSSLVIDKKTDWCTYFKNGTLPIEIKEEAKFLIPQILTRYCRYYYISGDKHCRLTVDTDICFKRMSGAAALMVRSERYLNSSIIELKYSNQNDAVNYEIGTLFKARITRFSKYLEGISGTFLL